jgi:predicted nucleic acid-binding protein
VNLFLDTSVLLAACGSSRGSSRAIFNLAHTADWTLMTSPYVVNELTRNLSKLPDAAVDAWAGINRQLAHVDDVFSLNLPVVFPISKDRPILFTALAWSNVLLTLDRQDFVNLLGRDFYGLRVRFPYEFLREERAAGRLKIS